MSDLSRPTLTAKDTHPTPIPEDIHQNPPADADYIDIFPTPSTRRGANYLTLLCLCLGCAMCMSNICAVKIWQVGPFILDGGFLLFPITYVVTDVLVELFYRRYANRVVLWSCLVNAVCFLFLRLTSLLPASPTADQIDITNALGLSSRIFIASIVATIVSSRINNRVYDYLRPHTQGKPGICIRAWISSFFAHLLDSGIFTFLAFAGRQSSFQSLCQQALTSYLSAFAVETALMPITVFLSAYLRRQIQRAA